ncbi:ABC transporter ATP-binding protein [Blastococcus saxobsidens]|uniref:Iron-dicitrate transporter subunit ATP-binding component of ABC superfamily n=1 Tax=Blastococcus saxobsidens (strain DD2) TaxID=1146883 RepID=H6RUF0_BLASD|nr:ABC transporter ATP-binding protein [Blastococcus saxobsidens]CCG01915.1 iron-dicitrate transporter subunit; ATP-binding component of ABC superfamily [Blastococcus saxobsidens DD2]
MSRRPPVPVPAGGARVEVVGLSAGYGRRPVLSSVRFAVDAGGWLGIIGPNGSGKSTLLRSVLGLHPYEGEVRIDGAPTTGMPRRDRARLLAYAPQLPVLPEAVSTRDYVTLGRTPHRPLLAAPRAVDREVVAEVMTRLELTALADRAVVTLSGGEQQRAVLARALAQQPRVLLLDEPTAALDLGHAQQVLDLLDHLRRQDGLTVVSTLHDLTLAGQYADRLTLLADGRVAAEGTPEQVLTAEALSAHYGARARIVPGAHGPAVLPVR